MAVAVTVTLRGEGGRGVVKWSGAAPSEGD